MQFIVLFATVIAAITAHENGSEHLHYFKEQSDSHAFDPCATCYPNKYGVGYAPSYYCNQFYKCQLLPGGGFEPILMCCPDGMSWDQYMLTCMPGHCYEEDYSDYDCPPSVGPLGDECYLLPHINEEMFYMIVDGALQEMHCAPQTHYDHENCTCVHGGSITCDNDPMLYFPFGNHDNDVQCQRAEGFSHGDAHLNASNGAVCFDGDGDFVEIPFLANWFTGFYGSFTVSLWYFQEQGHALHEALFSNAECDSKWPPVVLALFDGINVGGVSSYNNKAFFGPSFTVDDDRRYSSGVWNHVAIRYDSGVVSFFLNGEWISDRFLSDDIKHSLGPVTIGTCNYMTQVYFTGCIDDVMVFNRYVSNDEIKNGVFAHKRTEGNLETPY